MTRWSDAELEVIRRMWAERHSASHIANTLGEAGFHRTRNSVISVVHRFGFQRDVVPANESVGEVLAAAEERKGERRAAKAVEKRERAPAVVERRPPPARRPPEAPEPEMVPVPAPRPLPPEGGVALLDLENWHCRRVIAAPVSLLRQAPGLRHLLVRRLRAAGVHGRGHGASELRQEAARACEGRGMSRFDREPGLASPEDFRRAAHDAQTELLRTDVFDLEKRERIQRRIARLASMARRLEWMASQPGRAVA